MASIERGEIGSRLEHALDSSLDEGEIQDALNEFGVNRRDIRAIVLQDREQLEADAEQQSSALAAARSDLTAAREIAAANPPRGQTLLTLAVFWLTLGVAGTVVQGVIAAFAHKRWIWGTLADGVGLMVAIGAAVILLVGWVSLTNFYGRRGRRAERAAGIPQAELTIEEEERRFDEALVEQVALPRLREVITRVGAAPFTTTLDVGRAPGLAEVHNSEYEVPTSAGGELKRLLTVMSGGSIGVAGPRGSGKTTLIRSFADGRQEIDRRGEILGVLVAAPVVYDAKDFLLYLFETVCRAVLGPAPESLIALPRRGGSIFRRGGGASAERLSEVERDALQHLRSIRYQRTIAAGVALSIGIPAVRGQGDLKDQLAQQPRSLPQVTNDLQAFIRALTRDYTVIISIDELDKIESGEAARRFVNDAKAIFGVRDCFYLVALSEDAMSAFDRRGAPVRDAFDSAFDAVLRVPPLLFADCQRVLRRRVIGMGDAFQALATVLAGGLPRDVIRFARQMVLASEDGDDSLAGIAQKTIATEIAAKARAATVVATRYSARPSAPEVLAWLRAVEKSEPAGALGLTLTAAESLRYRARTDTDVPAEQRGDDDELSALAAEVTAWVYHTDTVLRVFGAEYGPEVHGDMVKGGLFDALAAARQDLAVSPSLSWRATSEVRQRLNIEAQDFPD